LTVVDLLGGQGGDQPEKHAELLPVFCIRHHSRTALDVGPVVAHPEFRHELFIQIVDARQKPAP
jgi:hypothetical protein